MHNMIVFQNKHMSVRPFLFIILIGLNSVLASEIIQSRDGEGVKFMA